MKTLNIVDSDGEIWESNYYVEETAREGLEQKN